MFDGLIDMFSKGLSGLGNLFGGSSPAATGSTWVTNPALDSIAKTADMTKMGDATFDFSKGLAGSGLFGDMFKGIDLMDMGKLGLGYMGMQEMKKNNKLNRTLTQQNIDENNRITDGREKVAGIFNSAPSLAAGY